MSEKQYGKKPQGKTLTDELVEIEYEIANLLVKRTALLGRAASVRFDKGKPVVDPNQERRLRIAWDTVAGRNNLDVRDLRKIFALANGLAYAQAVRPDAGQKDFALAPKPENLDLVMAGPRCVVRTRLMAAAAAATGSNCELKPVALNDPLVEMSKGFNQAGAGLSWEGTSFRNEGGELSFDGKTVFVGDDVLNMYLLMAFALPHIGRFTFTGGTNLRVADLGLAAGVFTVLGARLTALEPFMTGLPARLESAGIKTDAVTLPDDFPVEAAMALALAGTTYPEGLKMTWGQGWTGAGELSQVVDVLKVCGVEAELGDDSFVVPPSALVVPEAPGNADLPMDAVLCGVLLAIPRFAGGRVVLSGTWPQRDARAKAMITLLKDAGLRLEISSSGVASARGPWPNKADFNATDNTLLPLATLLGLSGPGDVRLTVSEDADVATVEQVAERMGRFARVKPGRIVLVGGRTSLRWKDPDVPMSSPSPLWTMALCLASVTAPGVCLSNPGTMSSVWPGFLSLVSNSFTIKKEEPSEDDKPNKKGRRIRID